VEVAGRPEEDEEDEDEDEEPEPDAEPVASRRIDTPGVCERRSGGSLVFVTLSEKFNRPPAASP
jgi:hypothetical protein